MRNGNPAQAMIFNTAKGNIEKEIPIPTTVTGTHGQFRHIRMTKTGTLLVPHLGENKVVEYDLDGKVLWSVPAKSPWQAVRLKSGNTLIAGDWSRYAREVSPRVSTAGWRVYDSYLKANRVAAGTASYDEVIRLVLGTRVAGLPAWDIAAGAR